MKTRTLLSVKSVVEQGAAASAVSGKKRKQPIKADVPKLWEGQTPDEGVLPRKSPVDVFLLQLHGSLHQGLPYGRNACVGNGIGKGESSSVTTICTDLREMALWGSTIKRTCARTRKTLWV